MSVTKTDQQFSGLEKQLTAQRDKLRLRFVEQRTDVYIDREPDDEGAEASRNLATHLLLSNLDRDRRILGEIELALERLKTGEYGICESCGESIPGARLQALTWARFCIHCTERANAA